MARPLKPRTLDSFPHPCGSRHNPKTEKPEKIEMMTAAFGNDGYAFYYRTLETVYRYEDCTLILNDTMRRILMNRLRVRSKRFDQMLETALELRLFDPDAFRSKRTITSPVIQAVASSAFRKREAERERYKRNPAARTGQETLPETP